ncbi:MAG TPA: response regulator, partial [Flavobacterium sp.]|nr:response regulator [Flavobacterium sp.]
NLVSNAVKFTNEGLITVSVHLMFEDDEKVIIEFAVNDTGIGISKDKMESIFENFQQASSGTSRLYGGTGLGLAIVKQLVESQGGSIRVKSKINEYSRFSFTLPFLKTKENAALENEIMELNNEIKGIRVLVVEDMALNQLLMKTVLDDFGFERDIAENGKIAIEKLKTKQYDIVLMDLQMPEMNGFEATEYIRETLKLNIPIIALTADVTTVDLAKCKAVGMDDYIAKPIDERVLYSKIVGLIKNPKNSKPIKNNTAEVTEVEKIKYINLNYLNLRTKSNPKLMIEMIGLYLEQTPELINTLKQSLLVQDWNLLNAAIHKMIPSFSIMGMHSDFENMAKKIQEFVVIQQQNDEMENMVLKLEDVCMQACKELELELETLKKSLK